MKKSFRELVAGIASEIVRRWEEIDAAGCQAGQVEQSAEADLFERQRLVGEIVERHLMEYR